MKHSQAEAHKSGSICLRERRQGVGSRWDVDYLYLVMVNLITSELEQSNMLKNSG